MALHSFEMSCSVELKYLFAISLGENRRFSTIDQAKSE